MGHYKDLFCNPSMWKDGNFLSLNFYILSECRSYNLQLKQNLPKYKSEFLLGPMKISSFTFMLKFNHFLQRDVYLSTDKLKLIRKVMLKELSGNIDGSIR